MKDLSGKTVVVGVCGGIAAYKTAQVVSGLKKRGVTVHVIMTESATRFVTPLTFQSLCGTEVITGLFQKTARFEIEHISLAKKADLFLVAPATANMLGKVAAGIADDMLSTTLMATRAPVVFVPAMNVNMYNSPAVQRNIGMLKELGHHFVGPADGYLACGDSGSGKMEEPEVILEYLDMLLHPKKDLAGKRVLVTAGATKSLLDPVRYFSNFSSGKMGFALAREARDRGAVVTLVTGETHLPRPRWAESVTVRTNAEMKDAVLERFPEVDMLLMSAAVLDYKVKEAADQKIKKGTSSLVVELVQDTDILKLLGQKKTTQLLVGFAAESQNVLEYAKGKLAAKNLDFIVANDISLADSGFHSDFNTASILASDGSVVESGRVTKEQLAAMIFDRISGAI